MDDLLVKLNAIKTDKDTYLLPGNLKKDVTVLGVTGTLESLDTSDATATASDIAEGKTAYVNGQKIAGSLNYLSTLGDGISYTPNNIFVRPAGEPMPFDICLTGNPTLMENVIISENDNVYAYVQNRALANAINLLPNQIVNGVNVLGVIGNAVASVTQEKVIAPSTSIQNIVPDEGYTGLSKVTINAVNASVDPNIVPEKIANGVSILGVTGTAIGANLTTLEVLANGTYTAPSGYDGFSSVEVMVPSTGAMNIFIQNNEPTVKQGIWINSLSQAYSLQEINNFNVAVNYGVNQLLVVRGFDINTKVAEGMTYYFNTVILTDANASAQLSLSKYYGNGSSWILINDGLAVLTPEEAVAANSELDDILGQPDQGDTDNLTPEEDIEANEIADYILGNSLSN